MSSNDTTRASVPEDFLKDAQGRLVPKHLVKPVDLLRDEMVRDLVITAKDISAVLARFKKQAFTETAAFTEQSMAEYGVKFGGDKGNLTLYSFDGRYKLVRQVSETLRFDERLKAAKALIDECLTDWAAGAADELKVIIDGAFQVNKEGYISTDRVLSLRRYDIKDEKWLRAMDAIGDSLQVIGSSSYIRVYERVGDTDKYEAIPLDIAKV